jgi:hypothetical protein
VPRLILVVLTFFVVVFLGSCGAPTPPAGGGTPPDAVIVGTLADASGTPLVGQQVTLTPAVAPSVSSASIDAIAASAAAIATTDGRGAFGFDVAEPGTFVLANVGDTTGAMARVTVQRGSDGQLTSSGSVGMTALELGAVTGRVVDRGAGVLVFLSGTSFVAMTGSDGTFAISRVPAGSYEAVASVAGAIGAPVQVTVTSGGVAALATELRVGPVINGVTPAGFVPVELDIELGGVLTSPAEYVLSGSGFGAERGLGRLTYGGCEVPFDAVTRWSDSEIAIDPNRAVDGDCDPRFLDADDLRFVVRTLAGSATSPVSGAYSLDVQWWSEVEDLVEATPASVGVGFRAGFYITPAGLTVAVDADNGTVQTMAGTPLSTWTTTGGYEYYNAPSFRVVPSSWLPIVLTLDPTADSRVAGEPQRFAVRGGSLFMDLWGARGYVELESLVRAGRGGSRGRSTYLQRVLSQSVSFGGGVGRGSLLGARWSGKTWVRACRLVSRSARA